MNTKRIGIWILLLSLLLLVGCPTMLQVSKYPAFYTGGNQTVYFNGTYTNQSSGIDPVFAACMNSQCYIESVCYTGSTVTGGKRCMARDATGTTNIETTYPTTGLNFGANNWSGFIDTSVISNSSSAGTYQGEIIFNCNNTAAGNDNNIRLITGYKSGTTYTWYEANVTSWTTHLFQNITPNQLTFIDQTTTTNGRLTNTTLIINASYSGAIQNAWINLNNTHHFKIFDYDRDIIIMNFEPSTNSGTCTPVLGFFQNNFYMWVWYRVLYTYLDPLNCNYTYGKTGGAYNLNGQNESFFTDSSRFTIDYDTPLTACAWVAPKGNNSGALAVLLGGNTIISQTVGLVKGWRFDIIYDSVSQFSRLTFAQMNSLLDGRLRYAYVQNQITGNPQHVCVTYTGNNNISGIKMYIDGENYAVSGSDYKFSGFYPITTSENFNIGTLNYTGRNGMFNGTLDELRLMNVALNATEVKMLYMSSFDTVNDTYYVFSRNNTVDPLKNISYNITACDFQDVCLTIKNFYYTPECIDDSSCPNWNCLDYRCYDLGAYDKLRFSNHSYIDSLGNWITKGKIDQSQTCLPRVDSVLFQTQSGNTFGYINNTNDICINGTLYQNQSNINCNGAVVQNKTGDVVGCVDVSGNIYLKGFMDKLASVFT